eukprot:gb/GECG01012693.1/.p1 GENE.gb/GECG01012693.1/~~gb/GECG01012693.1/.p1  ORF type:complete len:840 (+),score=88.00 gb/GECG01012693.1/:1-2520(+)
MASLGVDIVVDPVFWGLFGCLFLLVASCIAYCGLPSWLKKDKKSLGSGANSYWNRYIDMNPPKHAAVHHKMKYKFRYGGSAGEPGTPEKPGRDKITGYPVTGHLVGRQTWIPVGPDEEPPAVETDFTFDPSVNPNSADKLLRAQQLSRYRSKDGQYIPVSSPKRGEQPINKDTVEEALHDAISFYTKLQCEDGHWAGDYGGPFFLLPGLVLACHICGYDLGEARRDAIITYMKNHQQENGGWGLHMEGPSTMFGSALHYCALRALGLSRDDPVIERARQWIHENGSALAIPSWGKFWLSTFGVYDWKGCNSIPPELWLLPEWFPFHPWRMWCHARMVYLPMSFIYGGRYTAEIGSLQRELREELYTEPYEEIDWDKARNNVCLKDLYSPHTKLMDFLNEILKYYEKMPLQFLRNRALKFCSAYMQQEDLQTNWVDIGPVNKVMNMLSIYYQYGNDDTRFKKHAARLYDYLWVAEDGMKMQGYNGSQLWDLGFAVQAITAGGPLSCGAGSGDTASSLDSPSFRDQVSNAMRRSASYLDYTQIKKNEEDHQKWFRIMSKGGWPFSTNDHGWPIADCTAEGLKGTLLLEKYGLAGEHRIPQERLEQSVDLMLHFQNDDGGWATYEQNRGWDWFEWLNPAEVFGDIMIDYTYVELTSACVTALNMFRTRSPHYRRREVDEAIQQGIDFVKAQQREDGGFYGSWGVCFTYACWFGVESLIVDGSEKNRENLRKVCEFLLSKQNPDGGWGESYISCVRKEYTSKSSTAFQTSWALLALIDAQCEDKDAVSKGVQFLLSSQTQTGDWPQESVAGVFNRTCGITYTAYRNIFPIWALNAYRFHYHFV